MKELFGTDGVRGIANKELTGELAFKIGKAGGYYLAKNMGKSLKKAVMLIGKDTRVSGDMLESALIAGMTSAGIDVIRLGIIPTPGVAYLTSILDVIGSVMISASHNPIADNGIKFFQNNGIKLTDRMEKEIEKFIFDKYQEIPAPTHTKIGNSSLNKEYINKYLNHLVDSVEGDFSKLKVVIDCASGAAYKLGPSILQKLGAEVKVINNIPDGSKINVNSGSTHPQLLRSKVLATDSHLGIAHDGDADRVVLIDEKGNILDGDKIMAVLALYMNKNGSLNKKTLVTTRYSNLGLKEILEKNGARIVTAKNGDRYVLKKMMENNYNLGGEKSGHIILLDYNKTGDGILTAIKMMEVMLKTGKSLSELGAVMQEWPQELFSVKVKNKDNWNKNKKILDMEEKAEYDLGKEGRVFIRASGTEPVIRVMLESKNENKLKYWRQKLEDIISRELN
ncbi:MAG: phosphoglucosamine mutase [Bacillota bacterium]